MKLLLSTVFATFLQQNVVIFLIRGIICVLSLYCCLCLPRCFAYSVFLPIFSLFMFPINSSRTCSSGASFQSALLFLSHLANPTAIFFFPVGYSALCYFPGFLSLSPPPSMQNSAGGPKHGCDLCCPLASSPFLLSSSFPPDIPLERK